jgi:membrane protein
MSGRAPDKPTDLPKKSWLGILKSTGKQFSEDKLTHWAAALTYYGILSLFPAIIALVSLLGIFGTSATQPLLDNLEPIAPGPAKDILTTAITNVQGSQGTSTVTFIIGLLAAIWAASGYIGAWMDASNAVWDVPEGRPIWKKLPIRLGLTILLLVMAVAGAIAVVISGPIAEQVGNLIGAGDAAVTAWSIAKWPVLVILVSLMFSILYWIAPNVKQPGFPWVTMGGLLAVVLWIVASALFAFYVANFGSYNKTYGSLGGVVSFLVWMWISNIVFLLGAEFNSEAERARQIHGGMPEDQEPYLPMRDEPKDATKTDDLGAEGTKRFDPSHGRSEDVNGGAVPAGTEQKRS